MRKILSLSMIVIWVGICMSGYAEEGIPANLEYAISQAVLDGCGDLTFLLSYDEPMFEVLVESHEILQVEKHGDQYSVWLIASAAVFRENDPDGVQGNPSKINIPIMLRLRQIDDTYSLIEYNEPIGGSWGDDIRRIFPVALWEKAFAGNPQLFNSLEVLANVYFADRTSSGSWRTPVSVDQSDPAIKEIFNRFARYPQWEGRSILTRSQTDQVWFYLSINGEDGYHSPCTFTKFDKSGKCLSYAVVQCIDGQLALLDGEFPPTDE